jgi:hypothetical protein
VQFLFSDIRWKASLSFICSCHSAVLYLLPNADWMSDDIADVGRSWPEHPRLLIPGVNDTWNDFQRFYRGKTVTPDDWKVARAVLHEDFKTYLASGGEPLQSKDDTFRSIFNACKL